MTMVTVGIDLAKNVYQIHDVDSHGKTVLKQKIKRNQLTAFFVNKPPCLIGMEACSRIIHKYSSYFLLRGNVIVLLYITIHWLHQTYQ